MDSKAIPAQPDNSYHPDLLDLHLGRLSESQRSQLTMRIASDQSLAAQHEALSEVFRVLDLARDAAPPAGLAERIMARITTSAGTTIAHLPRVVRPVPDNAPGGESDRVIRLHSLRDVLAVAAMVVLAVGLGVPSMLAMRERSQRTSCALNLAQVGRGVQSYATTFGNSLPFSGWSENSSWRPSPDPTVVTVPNRRHVYLLLRTQQVPSAALVCPSSKDVAMPADQVRSHDDFLEARNVSYASQNMAGVRPSLLSNNSIVIFADDTPLFDDGLPLYDLAARKLGLSDPAQSNSRAHGGVGQNILRLSGESLWTTTPNSGIGGDNIWTLENVGGYTGREGPKSPTDSHLLK